MAELITPAGLAICAALHLACQSPFDFAKTIPVSAHDAATDRMRASHWGAEIPSEFRYDYLAICLDSSFEGNAQCGFYDVCIAVAVYVDSQARIGNYRLCRREEKTS